MVVKHFRITVLAELAWIPVNRVSHVNAPKDINLIRIRSLVKVLLVSHFFDFYKNYGHIEFP